MSEITIEFDSPINIEGSWGSRPVADKAHSKMTLTWAKPKMQGCIEWQIDYHDGGDDVEEIGIWVEAGVLVDYDGVMSLPEQAVELLEKAGITVPSDFRD